MLNRPPPTPAAESDCWQHRRALSATTAALLLVLGSSCRDATSVSSARPQFIISNPDSSLAATASAAEPAGGATAEAPVVFVSLPPGSIPEGIRATIRNLANSDVVSADFRDGGFDPVRVHARAGDSIAIEVNVSVDPDPLRVIEMVNPRRRPIIVRTDPPNRKRDVPLNKIISVVFSEPIEASVLTNGAVRLMRGGVAVAARLAFTDELQIALQLSPEQPLASGAEYEVAITSAVRDLNGDTLDESAVVSFSTITPVATRLAFTFRPETLLSGVPVTPALRVAAVDDAGNIVTSFGGPVNIAIGVNPGGVTVNGNLAAIAVDGVASFDNVVFNRSARGMTLVASTPNLAAGHSPAFDVASGGKVVFTSPHYPPPPASKHLYVLNLDGGEITQLTTGAVRDGTAAWSPDGSRLAFAREGSAEIRGIYVMNADGSGLSRLTSSGTSPAWSPNGAKIAYADSGILVISSDASPGAPVQRLTDSAWDDVPAWSPDGSTIAFNRSVDLFGDSWNFVYVMNADGSTARRLTGPCTYGCGNTSAEGHPSWSPDGRTLTFWSFGFGVTVIGRDGSQPYSVIRPGQIPGSATGVWYQSNPDWSPDGKSIVFVVDGQLYLARAGGSTFWMKLTSVPAGVGDPAWSRRSP